MRTRAGRSSSKQLLDEHVKGGGWFPRRPSPALARLVLSLDEAEYIAVTARREMGLRFKDPAKDAEYGE